MLATRDCTFFWCHRSYFLLSACGNAHVIGLPRGLNHGPARWINPEYWGCIFFLPLGGGNSRDCFSINEWDGEIYSNVQSSTATTGISLLRKVWPGHFVSQNYPTPWGNFQLCILQTLFKPLNPFTPESDQCQNSPAASPEILCHTVWRTWLFIAYSDERWL